jgi:hypothetical protein
MPETTIGGIRYSMKPLGGRETRAVGIVVTSSVLRGVAVAMGKADLSKLVDNFQKAAAKDDLTAAQQGMRLLTTMSWKDIASTVGGVADGGATVIEQLGPDGMEVLAKAFSSKCSAWLPSPVANAGVYETPLDNQDDHWVGRWPQFLQWLWWGVSVNGFLGDLGALVARSSPPSGTAGGSASGGPT